MEVNLNNIKKVHLVGIGGIGISAIARLLHIQGKEITGSDMSESPVTEKLRELGIRINIGHDLKNIEDDTDLVVQTIAIPENNPEILEAKHRNILLVTYPEMLSVISKDMYTIAVSGTHGKTTTTAMLAKILIDAGLDPTVIVGSLMKDQSDNTGSNLVVGKSKYFIVEACEYRRSFLNLNPKILIITNIEEDHLDYYKDLSDIQSAFRELALKIPEDGAIICDTKNPNLQTVLNGLICRIIDYKEYIDGSLRLKVPGTHNIENASASLAVSDFLENDNAKARESLSGFSGTWRRFDLQDKTRNGAIVYDDYAHHPQEVRATLKGLNEIYPDFKKVVFFQPHQFSRTKMLLEQFGKSFGLVDEAYILPIYPAREIFDPTINSEMLVNKIVENNGNAFYVENFEIAKSIIENFDSNTVVMTMGAGDVYKINKK